MTAIQFYSRVNSQLFNFTNLEVQDKMENHDKKKRDWTGFILVFLGVPVLFFVFCIVAKLLSDYDLTQVFNSTSSSLWTLIWAIVCWKVYPDEIEYSFQSEQFEKGYSVCFIASTVGVLSKLEVKSSSRIPKLPTEGEWVILASKHQSYGEFEAKVTSIKLVVNQTNDGDDYVITVITDCINTDKLADLGWESVVE